MNLFCKGITLFVLIASVTWAANLNILFLGIDSEKFPSDRMKIQNIIEDYLALHDLVNLIEVETRDNILIKNNVSNFLVSADRANEIYNLTNSHLIVGVKILDYTIKKKRLLKILPFGKLEGTLRYQLVIWNAVEINKIIDAKIDVSFPLEVKYVGYLNNENKLITTAQNQDRIENGLTQKMASSVIGVLDHGLIAAMNESIPPTLLSSE